MCPVRFVTYVSGRSMASRKPRKIRPSSTPGASGGALGCSPKVPQSQVESFNRARAVRLTSAGGANVRSSAPGVAPTGQPHVGDHAAGGERRQGRRLTLAAKRTISTAPRKLDNALAQLARARRNSLPLRGFPPPRTIPLQPSRDPAPRTLGSDARHHRRAMKRRPVIAAEAQPAN